jgi:hypothetical protein
MSEAGKRLLESLRQAAEGRFARVTTYMVTDLKTARRMERNGHSYTWEMDGGRPTGRCIVKMVSESNVRAI